MLRVKMANYLLESARQKRKREWERLFSRYVLSIEESKRANDRQAAAYQAVKAAERRLNAAPRPADLFDQEKDA